MREMNKTRKGGASICFRRWSRKGYSAFASLHREVAIGVLWVGMTIITLAADAAYASPVDSLALRNIEIEDIGVSQSKESPTRSAMASTPIYNRTKESQEPISSLEDALSLTPSVDVRARGGRDTQADISIRGGSFDQTQLMLNGINFTDARTGHQTHSIPIDIEAISSIELLNGVSGVGAYAGAINIRTAPLKTEDYMRVDLSGGSYGYAYANLSGAIIREKLQVFAAGSFRRADGEIYNTGFENWNGYLRATYDDERWGFFDAQVGFQRREMGENGFYSLSNPEQYETTHTALTSLRWVKSIARSTRLNSSVSYRKNLDNYEWIKGSTAGENFHNTDNIGAEIYVERESRAGVSTLGADYTYNHIWSTNLGEEQSVANGRYNHADSRNVWNFYARHTKRWARFDVGASVGVSTTPYGTSPIWSVSGGYIPTKGLRIEIGANESMRLPTFTDLYYTSKTQIPDPDLSPESARTYRLAAQYAGGKWASGVELYIRDGDNIIDWTHSAEDGVNDSGADIYHARQITELVTYGAEWSASYSPRGFVDRVSVAYGYITQDKSSQDMVSLYAQNYMHNKASIGVTLRPFRDFTLAVTGTLYDRNGSYLDASSSVVEYEPYFLLDGRAAWERGKWRVYLDATNITSTTYYEYGGLKMPDIWITSGISFTL